MAGGFPMDGAACALGRASTRARWSPTGGPVRGEGPREGGMGRARYGVMTAGDFCKQRQGREAVPDSRGQGGPPGGWAWSA